MYLVDKGFCEPIYKIKDQEMRQLYLSKQIDYTEVTKRVVEMQAQALAGLEESQVSNVGKDFLKSSNKLYPFVKKLLTILKKKGFCSILISGATNPSISAIAKYLGADGYFCSTLLVKDGKYTGDVVKILNNEEKKQVVDKLTQNNAEEIYKIGFGDSTGDVDLLTSVDKAIVVNSHQEEMLILAKEKGWFVATSENIVNEVKTILKNVAK